MNTKNAMKNLLLKLPLSEDRKTSLWASSISSRQTKEWIYFRCVELAMQELVRNVAADKLSLLEFGVGSGDRFIKLLQFRDYWTKRLGCVDIWCIMDTCQRLNYAMNNGRKSLNFCAHAQTSTLERRTIAGATSRPSCGWHEVVLLGDCCLSTTVTGTAYISASHAGVKRVYGNECISILCKTPIWSMSSLIAL